jgi:type IV pilus assembly protein PilA
MKNKQHGFTLIELMIVVAIIGILASVAMSAYQNYIIRAQISEGLTLSSTTKVAMSEYFMDRGVWAGNNATAGVADKFDIKGKYVRSVDVDDNVIEIIYGNDAHNEIFDEIVWLTAISNNGSVSWTCTSGGVIPPKHLPASCR